MQRSLRSKVRLLILLPLCGLGVIAVCSLGLLSTHEIRERTQKDAKSTSRSLAQFISERRRNLEVETKILAESPFIRALALDPKRSNTQYDLESDATPTSDRKIVIDPLSAQSQVSRYSQFLNGDGLALIDSDGNIIGASGPLKGIGKAGFHAFGLESALDGNTWSGFVRTDRGLAVVATAPLLVGNYAHGAAICYSMITEYVARTLASELSVQVAFVEGGTVVANSWGSARFTVATTANPSYVEIGGKRFVGLYTPIPDATQGEGFIAFRSVSEVIGPSEILLAGFFAVFVFAMTLAAYLADRFARGLVRPIELVAAAARMLENGEWPARFEVNRTDEIGDLQLGFNRMTDAVRENEAKLLAMVHCDPLTGLPNHRRFKESLAESLFKERVASLVLFGFDRFNDYNREEGFAAGDQAIKRFAESIGDSLPKVAVVARYGGDEFAVLMPGIVLEQAKSLAEKSRRDFAKLCRCTVSAGCASLGASTDLPESLCLAAELALAQAKQLGRNQVCDFGALSQQGYDPYELDRFLQDGTLATIQALAAAVDAKDSYTKGHSQRVAEYAAELCRYMGHSDQEVELVFRTGTLHDVGKIGVPDHVLKKEGPLTAEERAIMETHAALGELIVKKVPQLQDTLPGVRNHHERWDGRGYPDGLAGEGIPWLGRILAVADTYDAMTSDRPYRKGLPLAVATAEIAKNAGKQFDPLMARAFVEMISREERQAA